MTTMTKIAGVPDKDDVVPGMAFYRGSGPVGTTCASCQFYGYMRKADSLKERWYKYQACEQFKKLTGRHGPVINKENASCKYYKGPKTK